MPEAQSDPEGQLWPSDDDDDYDSQVVDPALGLYADHPLPGRRGLVMMMTMVMMMMMMVMMMMMMMILLYGYADHPLPGRRPRGLLGSTVVCW